MIATLTTFALAALAAPQEAAAPENRLRFADFVERLTDRSFLAGPVAEGEVTQIFAGTGAGTAEAGSAEVELLDAEGPGVLGRLWIASPAGTLRFYVDGDREPTLEYEARVLFSATGPFASPITQLDRQRGVSRMPLPFAKSLRVTTTQVDPRYEATVHRFGPGVQVESVSAALLAENQRRIASAARELLTNGRPAGWRAVFATGAVNHRFPFEYEIPGNGVVHWLQFGFITQDAPLEADEHEEYMRSIRLTVEDQAHLEGQARRLVDVPFGDFFGTAPGLQALQDGTMMVDPSAGGERFRCRVPMPYTNGFRLRLENVHRLPKTVRFRMDVGYEQLPEVPPLRLHASFFQLRDLATQPERALEFARLRGPGRLVGLTLTGLNAGAEPWAEGPMLIEVDGQPLAGGGALSADESFDRVTRRDGPYAFGYTSRNRFRIHDPVVFEEELAIGMRLRHAEQTELDLEGIVYWYGAVDEEPSIPSVPDESFALAPVPAPQFEVKAGRVQAEGMDIERATGDGKLAAVELDEPQGADGELLRWSPIAAQDFARLAFSLETTDRFRVQARMWCAPGAPSIRLAINGKEVAEGPLELAREQAGWVSFELGEFVLGAGDHSLLLGVVDAGAEGGPGMLFDYLSFEPVRGE